MKRNSSTDIMQSREASSRFQIVVACFLATFTAYVERTGFSIAYTAMAKEAATSEAVKGTVLSSFYWGYGVSQIPGGLAAQRFGGETTLTLSFLLWSCACLFTPGTAENTRAIIVARVCIGIAQGLLIPAIHTVLSRWTLPTERAKAVSLTTSGMYLGSAAAMLVLPTLVARMGPAALLRFVGLTGLCWTLFWRLTLGRVKRQNAHQWIPVVGGASAEGKRGVAGGKSVNAGATPWRLILAHPAIWAIIVNNYAFHYAFYVVMNWLPTYFDHLLRTNLACLGFIKTLPYLTMFAASNAGGWVGDWLIHSKKRSVAGGRKTVNTAGFWVGCVALMFMPAAKGVASGIMCTTLTLGACGFARGGFSVNHMDVAPKFAGVVMGISNTAGTLSGVIGVAITGQLLQAAGGAEHRTGWYQAMALCALQCLAGSAVFLGFARGERLFGADITSFP